MRPVTVFVLLLFASGVVGGELYGRTLAAQRLAQLSAQHRAAACTACALAPAAPSVGACTSHRQTPSTPRTRHRRIVGRGLLPALRAGPAA